MKTTNKTIGKIVAGCVLACCLTTNIQAQFLPGDTNSGSGGTNTYSPYGNFNPTPTITYPTNAKLKWYLAIYNTPIYSSLALAPDGTLYVPIGTGNGDNGALLSINTSLVDTNDIYYPAPDDFLNWTYVVNGGFTFSPSVAVDGTVYNGLYVPSYPATPNLGMAAINPTNASILWSFCKNSYRSCSPVAIGNDGTIYTCSAGYVYALTNAIGVTNSTTNAEGYVLLFTNVASKWTYNGGGENVNTFSGDQMLVGLDGTVYAYGGYYSGILYAFNPTNGVLKWKTTGLQGSQAYTTPAIGKDGAIYLPEGSYFCAVNPQSPVTNGIINYSWVYTNNLSGDFQYSPIIGADGTIYVEYRGYGTTNWLYAMNPSTGIPIWTNALSPAATYYGNYFKHGSLATSSDGEIYLADLDGTLYSFAPDGTMNWKYLTGAQALGSPLISPDGTLYVESVDRDHNGCYVYAFAIPSPVACSSWPEDGRNARRTAAVATASVGSPVMTTNGFQFAMIVITNMPVCAFASSDLQIWTNIGQTLLTGGMTNFVDIGSTNYPYRFYRAMPQ